jgi:hypothetical protein
MTRKSHLLLALFIILSTTAQSQDEFVRFLDSSGNAIHMEGGSLQVGRAQPGWFSAMWELGSGAGQRFFPIRNRYTGEYLIASQGKVITSTATPSRQGMGDHYWRRVTLPGPNPYKIYLQHSSGQFLSQAGAGLALSPEQQTVWSLDPVAPPAPAEKPIEYVRLQMASQPTEYLNVERGGLETGQVQPGWLSARWEMKQTGGGRGMQVAFRNIYTSQWLIANGNTVTAGDPVTNQRGGGNYTWRVIGNSQDPSQKGLYHADSGRPLCGGNGFYLGEPNQDPLLWRFESPSKPAPAPPAMSYFHIGSVAAPGAKINNEGGAVQCSGVQPGWFSAMWEVEEKSGAKGRILAFRNRWTGDYLLMQGSGLATGPAQVSRDGRGPHLWQAVGSPSDPRQFSLQNLSTGAYLRFFTKTNQLGVADSNLGSETLWTVDKL